MMYDVQSHQVSVLPGDSRRQHKVSVITNKSFVLQKDESLVAVSW